MLRFLHAADFHLDSPFSALSPRAAADMRSEQRTLLARCLALAKARDVHVVLIAGDLFDGAQVFPETIELLHELFSATRADIFISPGNHDPYTKSSPYACESWPPHVHIFNTPSVSRVTLPELGCTVYGSAFCDHYRFDSPLSGLAVSGSGLQLGCFHAELKKGSRYGPLSLEDLAASGLHYAALGHIHARSTLQKSGAVPYAYSGCVQGRGFDELGEKGCYYGELSEDGELRLEFVPLAERQYQSFSLVLDDRPIADQVIDLLPAQKSPHIARIYLRGERSIAQLSLAPLMALVEPFFFSVSLLDETHYVENFRAREGEDSLTGRFLRELRASCEAGTPEQRSLFDLAARYGVAALEGREEPR